jgi:hypothetical protein
MFYNHCLECHNKWDINNHHLSNHLCKYIYLLIYRCHFYYRHQDLYFEFQNIKCDYNLHPIILQHKYLNIKIFLHLSLKIHVPFPLHTFLSNEEIPKHFQLFKHLSVYKLYLHEKPLIVEHKPKKFELHSFLKHCNDCSVPLL